jgi:hypothetical protein
MVPPPSLGWWLVQVWKFKNSIGWSQSFVDHKRGGQNITRDASRCSQIPGESLHPHHKLRNSVTVAYAPERGQRGQGSRPCSAPCSSMYGPPAFCVVQLRGVVLCRHSPESPSSDRPLAAFLGCGLFSFRWHQFNGASLASFPTQQSSLLVE